MCYLVHFLEEWCEFLWKPVRTFTGIQLISQIGEMGQKFNNSAVIQLFKYEIMEDGSKNHIHKHTQ